MTTKACTKCGKELASDHRERRCDYCGNKMITKVKSSLKIGISIAAMYAISALPIALARNSQNNGGSAEAEEEE